MAGGNLETNGDWIATRAAFGAEIARLGEQYPEIVVLDADLSGSTQTGTFAKKFPDRAFNVGISEQDLIATAAGFAVAGKKPFACSFAVFLTGRAYDQIRSSVAISEMPVVLVGTHAGILTGEDGATHQSLEDIGLMRALPNMTVLSPADAVEARSAVAFAARAKNPVYLRLGRAGVPVIFDENTTFDFSRIRVLNEVKNPKVVVFATGPLVSSTLIALKNLEDEISVRIVNVCNLSHLDEKGVLDAISDTKRVITAEDHSVKNGLGSAIAEILAENGIGKKLYRHGMRRFGESGSTEDLYRKYKFDGKGMEEIIREFLGQEELEQE